MEADYPVYTWTGPGGGRVQVGWPSPGVVLVTGDAAEKQPLISTLSGGGATLNDIGGWLGVSNPVRTGLRLKDDDTVLYGVRVTTRAHRLARRDAGRAAHELAEWLDEHGRPALVVFDDAADELGTPGAVSDFVAEFRERYAARSVPAVADLTAPHGEVALLNAIHGHVTDPWHRGHPPDAEFEPELVFGGATPAGEPTPTLGAAAVEVSRRYVNTRVCLPGTDADVPRDRPLAGSTGYDVLVGIGAFDTRSVLRDAVFPDRQLPPGGRWLTVVVHAAGLHPYPLASALYLPESGDAYVCPCEPDTPVHTCGPEQRSPWVTVPLPMPAEPRTVVVRIAVYYRAAVVHVHELTLPMTGRRGVTARVEYQLTHSFGDLGPFASRSLSVFTGRDAGDRSSAYVNGVATAPLAYAYSEAQADNACRQVRTCLFDAHLERRNGTWRSRYDPAVGKDAAAYRADLLALARVGRSLHASVFGGPDAPQIRRLLLHEAAAGPVTVQFARPVRERLVIPWQAVYDLPMQSADADPYVCASVAEFGPGGRHAGPIPYRCPHEETHPRGTSVLCPFGFWGLAYRVEVPPHIGEQAGLVHVVSDRADRPVATLVGWNPQISPHASSRAEASRHLKALRDSRLGILDPAAVRRVEFGSRLGAPDMDLVYVYCHGERYQPAGAVVGDPKLVLGDGEWFTPQDVKGWPELYAWPWPHWPDRRPLVVLNACHTGEVLAATLADFVSAFIEAGGAAGVVATEVALEQRLAGVAMELFLARLADGDPAGAALRGMRWDLLGRGNVMGLAYSAHCAADLLLRPTS